MTVIELTDDSEYVTKLNDAAQRLVVADFYATWCGPCNMIAPFYKQLSLKYPDAMFLKIDVDKCPGTAAANNVSAMPTFVFFRNRVELERIRGADKGTLESKVKQYYTAGAGGSDSAEGGGAAGGEGAGASAGLDGGLMDLASMINKAQSECLNQDDDHTWEHAINSASSTYLKSDCDEQLLLHITFNQAVKLHSLIVQGPEDNGPKDVKIFINQTRTLDFDTATSNQAVQALELKPEDLKDNAKINLRFVKFQNVQSITLFFVNNQSASETTTINYLKFIGAPLNVTNMNEFKRVAGQAGEAHG